MSSIGFNTAIVKQIEKLLIIVIIMKSIGGKNYLEI